MNHVLFVAAENAALPGGKVGGVGDVVRDLPLALVEQGWQVTVIVPAYGFLHRDGARRLSTFRVAFAGRTEQAELWEAQSADGVRQLLIEHPLLSPQGTGKIYCDDGDARPFATDASKFAFFSAAVAAWLTAAGSAPDRPDVVHLHDWHAAFLLLLRQYDPACQALQSLRCVYTIHNLALQGIRPLSNDASSLESWYPGLSYDLADVGDPRYADCVNPMALGIRLGDAVNTVSPTYAREIRIPDDPARGFYGGEGLQDITSAAAREDRLVGILNGCMYPPVRRAQGWQPLARALRSLPPELDLPACLPEQLKRFARRRPRMIVTSVGRISDQKVALFLEPVAPAPTALDLLLQRLGDESLFVMLGNGDVRLERQLHEICERHRNALFITGYHEPLAAHLYDCGDLFLMPSSFEPCGISQMLAMRSGQPCVVHGVGGLRDTVQDGETGFVFEGAGRAEQARAFVSAFDRAMLLRERQPTEWRSLCNAAAAQRFDWARAALAYIDDMYCVNRASRGAETDDGRT